LHINDGICQAAALLLRLTTAVQLSALQLVGGGCMINSTGVLENQHQISVFQPERLRDLQQVASQPAAHVTHKSQLLSWAHQSWYQSDILL
jgi:hypothetical protein